MSATQTAESKGGQPTFDVEDFEIEDSAKVPSRSRNGMTAKIVETMDKLTKVGQSFPVTGESKTGSVAIQQFYKTANGYTLKRKVKDENGEETGEVQEVHVEPTHPEREGRKFTCKQENETRFRIWRTK